MYLSSDQFKQLHKYLLDAFDELWKVEQLVFFSLNEKLPKIVIAEDLSHVMFRVIDWSIANGKILDLIKGALDANPHHQDLRLFAEHLGLKIESEEKEVQSIMSAIRIQAYNELQQEFIRQEQKHQSIRGRRPGKAGYLFRDRIPERSRLRELLNNPNAKVITIIGRGGIGKTELLDKICGEIESGELKLSNTAQGIGVDGIIYFRYDGTNNLTLGWLFDEITWILGPDTIAARELKSDWLNQTLSIQEKVCSLLNKLNAGCYILVLDKFEQALQSNAIKDIEIRTLIDECLGPENGLRLLITTREPIRVDDQVRHKVRTITLTEGLPLDEAIEVLKELDPDGDLQLRDAPLELLTEAAQKCFCIPFALVRISGLLAERDQTLAQLLDNTALFNEEVLENLVKEQYARITLDQQHTIQALSVYNTPSSSLSIRYLLEAFYPSIDVNVCLRMLVKNSFVAHTRGQSTYYLHDIDQSYAYSCLAKEGLGTNYPRHEWHRRAAYFYMEIAEAKRAGRSFKSAVIWDTVIQKEWSDSIGHVVEHFLHAEAWQDLAQEYESVKRYYVNKFDLGNTQLCANLCYRLLNAARLAENKELEAEWLHDLAVVYQSLNNMAAAEQACLSGLEIVRVTKQPMLEGHFLYRLGSILRFRREHKRAKQLYKKSVQVKRKIGGEEAAAPAQGKYGEMLEDEGKLDEALRIQSEQIKKVRYINESLSFRYCIMRIYRKQGDYIAARRVFAELLELTRNLSNLTWINRVLSEAALIHILDQEEDKNQVFALLEESKQIADQVGRIKEIAEAHYILAFWKHLQYDIAGAIEDYEYVFALNCESISYMAGIKLGILKLAKSQIEADVYFRNSIAFCNNILKTSPMLYELNYQLALAELGLGHTGPAILAYQEALNICSAKGVVEGALLDLQLLEQASIIVEDIEEIRKLLRSNITPNVSM